MYLMFRLGRLDVLPVDDYGIRKAMQLAYRKRTLPNPDWMRRTAERWRPYRTIACWYLWRTLDRSAAAEVTPERSEAARMRVRPAKPHPNSGAASKRGATAPRTPGPEALRRSASLA
jgi:hypothetical protein